MERFGDKASEIDIEVLYTFKRLNAEYDLRGNSIMGRGNGQIRARGRMAHLHCPWGGAMTV